MPPRGKRPRRNNAVMLPLSQVPEAALPATPEIPDATDMVQNCDNTTQEAMDMVENLILLQPARKAGKRRLNQNSSALFSTVPEPLATEDGPVIETPNTKRKRRDMERKRQQRQIAAFQQAEKEAQLQRQRRLRADPEFREAENAARAEQQRQRRADPEFREAENAERAEQQRQRRGDPEFRQAENTQRAEQQRQRRADPEIRAAENAERAEQQRLRRADPQFREIQNAAQQVSTYI
jgi:hypothetical protein